MAVNNGEGHESAWCPYAESVGYMQRQPELMPTLKVGTTEVLSDTLKNISLEQTRGIFDASSENQLQCLLWKQ